MLDSRAMAGSLSEKSQRTESVNLHLAPAPREEEPEEHVPAPDTEPEEGKPDE